MQSFDQFIQEWSGKSPLYPPNKESFRGQCYQLFNFYNRDVIGAPDYLAPYAYQIYVNFEDSPLAPYYDKIEYSSGATPQRGDAVIWSPDLPGSDGAGHVEMCTIPGVIIFESFGCNWGGKTCHLTEHDFSYVLGWLRPKGVHMIPDAEHLHRLFQQFFRRNATDKEVGDYVGKISYTELIDKLVSQQAYKDTLEVLTVGGVAIRDNWQRQIEILSAKNSELAKALSTYQAANGDASKWQTLGALLRELLGLNK